jgi:hypothetical protein
MDPSCAVVEATEEEEKRRRTKRARWREAVG